MSGRAPGGGKPAAPARTLPRSTDVPRARMPGGTRNGLPAGRPYHYRADGAEAAREAEVAQAIASVRARLRGEPEPALRAVPGLPERCEDCGYLLTAPGHRLECGDTP